MTILITGGCGFIGTNFIDYWLKNHSENIWNIDNLTYAANHAYRSNHNELYNFVFGNIVNSELLHDVINSAKPRAIIHFAAETHVDNSIASPKAFIDTNINGTFALLESSLGYWETLCETERQSFRFINISTDEVYGSLSTEDDCFTEESPIKPNSPYSASKASADALVRSFMQTYRMPTITTRCSNNFGPYQNMEKLIPTVIRSILTEQKIPIYGDGKQIRDWLYVEDHITAIIAVLKYGTPGAVYNIGGANEIENLTLIKTICSYFDNKFDLQDGKIFGDLASFVDDRAGHDFRYAIDNKKIVSQTGWTPRFGFQPALEKTIETYSGNSKNFDK